MLTDYLQYVPSTELRGDFYNFQAVGLPQNTAARGRLYLEHLFRADAWRVFQFEDSGALKAIKHTISPVVRWSWSPDEALTNADHPFFSKTNAPRFDLFDPLSPDTANVSVGTLNEEQRLKPHHRVSLGLDTRLVARYGESNRSYQELLSAGIFQDIDLRYGIPDRLQIQAAGRYAGLSFATEFRIATRTIPARPAGQASSLQDAEGVKAGTMNSRTELRYSLGRYATGLVYQINPNQNLLSVSAGVSDLGAWGFSVAANYDVNATQNPWSNQVYQLNYNSSSKCWGFFVRFTQQQGSQRFNSLVQPGFSWTESRKPIL
jgi:hypothetical protein